MPGFFSFHKMVSTSIIKVTYVLGLILITIWSLVAIGLGIYAIASAARIEEPAMQILRGRRSDNGHRRRPGRPRLRELTVAIDL